MSNTRTTLSLGARLVAGLAAGALLFVGVATPAGASTSAGGCTVGPVKPVAYTNPAGDQRVRYDVRVSCTAGGRIVQVQQRHLESDFAADQLTGTAALSRTFTAVGSVVLSSNRALPDTEVFNEEILQSVRFRVLNPGGAVIAPWTNWERSAIQVMAN